MIVNHKDRTDATLRPTLAHYIVKYTSADTKVRMVKSNSISKQHMGLGRDFSKVPLDIEDAMHNPLPSYGRLPKDTSDVLSSYKAVSRGLRWVLGVPSKKPGVLA